MFKLFKRFFNRRKKIKLSKELKQHLKNDINALYGLCVYKIYEDTDSVKESEVKNESNN